MTKLGKLVGLEKLLKLRRIEAGARGEVTRWSWDEFLFPL